MDKVLKEVESVDCMCPLSSEIRTSEISGIETRHKMDGKRKEQKAKETFGMLQLCRLESSSIERRELLRGGRDVQNHSKTVVAG